RGSETCFIEHQTNDSWQAKPGGLTIDERIIREFLSLLRTVPIEFVQDVVTESGLPEYGLASPVRQYILSTKNDLNPGTTNRVLAALQFGSRQGNRVFVRRTDEGSVYGIRTNYFDRFPAASWQFRERRLWNFSE